MSEDGGTPQVSRKVSPLAVIVVVILIGVVVVAFVKRHGHYVTPNGHAVPMAAPGKAVMPVQPDETGPPSNTAAPAPATSGG